ncbi:MAG: hypothetical protein AB1567_08600, partial [bacterium]
ETLNIPDFHQCNLPSTTTLKVTIQPQMDTNETLEIRKRSGVSKGKWKSKEKGENIKNFISNFNFQ